ncbi:hypothetical protein N9J72_02870 [Candidatus Gracilibacteria bacterium]|nr:hypothetical protein [Candidatus Gracilibacteria bacterium]
MQATQVDKDYTIIGTSIQSPEKIIVEMDKKIFDTFISGKQSRTEKISLRDYIVSGEVQKNENISRNTYGVDALMASMK